MKALVYENPRKKRRKKRRSTKRRSILSRKRPARRKRKTTRKRRRKSPGFLSMFKNPVGANPRRRKRRKPRRRKRYTAKRRTVRRNPAVSQSDKDLMIGLLIAGLSGAGTFWATDKVNMKFGTQRIPLQFISLVVLTALFGLLSQRDKSGKLRYAAAGTAGVTVLLALNTFAKWTGGKGILTDAFAFKYGNTKDIQATAGLLKYSPTGQAKNLNRMYLSGNNNMSGLMKVNPAGGILDAGSFGNVPNWEGNAMGKAGYGGIELPD